MLNLRDYQQDIINKARKAFVNNKRVLVNLGCGSGKTVIAAYMCSEHVKKNPNNYVWFLVHRSELVEQTINTFINNDLPLTNIFVGMVQTVTRHLDRYKAPTMIIVDESHHSTSKTYTHILNAYPNVPVIGLTATPARLDGKGLGCLFTTLISGVSTEWLIANKYLAPYKYYAPKTDLPDTFKVKGSDYDMRDVYSEFEKSCISGDILEYIDPTKQGILYAPTILFSKSITEQINNKFGNIAVHFDGDTPKDERKQIVSDYRAGKIKILCNVDLIGEGFDVPDAEICYLCRPTLSTTLYIQQSMRCMRYKPNKLAIIYDFVGNVFKHGMPSDNREWSLQGKISTRNKSDDKELLVRQCKNCFRVYQGTNRVCPYCGYDNGKTKTQIKIDKERELEGIKKVQKREQGMAWTYEELVKIGYARNYTNPQYWARMVLRSRKRKI